jgi:hypothetical protein
VSTSASGSRRRGAALELVLPAHSVTLLHFDIGRF